MKRIGQFLVFAASLVAAFAASAAPTGTPFARLRAIQAGWVVDRMLVFHDTATMTNPDACPIITNGYIMNENDPGRRTFYAMLLGALLNGREVSFVVSGCFEGRPRIISVTVR